jgi:hypothetical protein
VLEELGPKLAEPMELPANLKLVIVHERLLTGGETPAKTNLTRFASR